jgi:hypothetical protein
MGLLQVFSGMSGLEHAAFTWVHATRSMLLFFKHFYASRFAI